MEVKDRIRAIRKEAGMTQEQFGEKIGVTKMAVTYYESGKRTPQASTLKLIAQQFKANETWLLTGEGEAHDPPTDEQEIAQVVATLRNTNERVKRDIIVGLSKASEDSLKEILGLILQELHSHGIEFRFDEEK